MQSAYLLNLKTKLQTLGALRPDAWERIMQLCQENTLKANESFIRKEGTLAYVAQGLLKEYDSHNRKTPSIINFIPSQQCLITRGHNKSHYLKACTPALIIYWSFEDLHTLYQEYKELRVIYDGLCAEYDEGLAYGRLILEEKSARQRVVLLLARYRSYLPLLSKKDLSHYLRLNYDYFTLLFHELL